MRYDAAQVEHLAAEYVLGTLQGAARRRFDRLITDRADVRFSVWRWERHLNGFASGLEPHKPPRVQIPSGPYGTASSIGLEIYISRQDEQSEFYCSSLMRTTFFLRKSYFGATQYNLK